MKKKKALILILLLLITLGYAYLNSELKINGTTGIAGNTWDVHFENVVPSSSNTVTPTVAPVANPQDKVTELTYSVRFNKPGDVYEFDVDIVNAGSIDAMVNLITSTIKIGNGEVQELNNSTLPSYLNYYVKYSDGVNISPNHLLNKESRETIKVRVEYKADISEEDLNNSAGKTIEFTYGLKYVQASNGAKPRPIANNCTYNGELTQGAEYINGQYTYRYMQERNDTEWSNITNDGWGVALTNKNSTDPVNTSLCTTINGKPIVSMSYMFYNSLTTSIDLSNFYTYNVTNMSNMFNNASNIESIDLSYLNTSNVTDMSKMFYYFAINAETLDFNLEDWNISKVTNTSRMFTYAGYYSKEISIDLHGWNINSIEELDYMFDYAGFYADVFKLNLEGWDLRNYKNDSPNTYDIFGSAGYNAKKSIVNLNNLKIGGKKLVLYSLLKNSNDIEVYMNNWLFDGTTDISQMFSNIFHGNYNLSKKYIEAKNWDISKITNTSSLFYQFAAGKTESTHIDLTGWKIDEDTTVQNIFYDIALYSDNSYIDLTNWDLGGITSLQYIFKYIAENNETATINLTGWDTSNITDMSYMFNDAATFTRNINIIGVEEFDTTKVTNMEAMFKKLSVNGEINWDLSKWDVSHVNNMNEMFDSIGNQRGDKSSTLDLSNWDISNVTSAYNMFSYMTNLRKIYANSDWEFTSVTNPTNLNSLFYGTPQIVGGNGTTYQGIYDSSMAKIDREGVPGFFTLKN